MSEMIQESDARAMVRLLGETVAVEGNHTAKKKFLMDGLCELISGHRWVWTLACDIKPGGQQTYAGFLHEGFNEAQFSSYLQALEHPEMGEVVKPFFQALAEKKGPVTMARHEIDPEGVAYHIDANRLWEAADIGSLIMSAHPLDATSMSGIAIYRSKSAPDFTSREIQMAHIILTEVPWLHAMGWPEDRGAKVPDLAPRQRVVLNLLLDGRDRKTIADHLEISENTVSGYIKEVYRHFGVNSQVSLIKKFMGNHLRSE